MNKLFTLLTCISFGAMSYGQVIFENDLSSWTAGVPDGMLGSKSSIDEENVVEETEGATYGTSMARLINLPPTSHKRFTTEALAVEGGETYEIKMWVSGDAGELRTGYYDLTNEDWGSYNEYLDIAAETGGTTTLLTQTITMPATCEETEFILSLINTDEAGISLDSIAIEVTAPPVAEEATIYEIQHATEAPYISPYADQLVITSGIVTGVHQTGSAAGTFYMQDGTGAWNGIYVYEDGTPVAIGDSVTVTGKVVEYFELTEITDVLTVVVNSSGNELPAFVELSTADVQNEENEGILVRVMDAECTSDDAGFGQFEVNDGSAALLIDDEVFAYTPTVGSYYNIAGVASYAFGEMKIYPRSIDDIEVTAYAGIEENTNTIRMYPNPATDRLTLTVSPKAAVAIYSITGEIVYQANGNVNQIDVSGLDAGVYQVVITQDNVKTAQRLVIR